RGRHAGPRGREREGIPIPDRRLRRNRAGSRQDLGPRPPRAHPDRQESRRHGDGRAARREEEVRDPQGELLLVRLMTTARANGVNLYYEEAGQGLALVFVHEFAGDYRSWHLQGRFFSRRYRTISFNARGYPPSDVPEDPRSEEHTSELQLPDHLVCRLLLEKKKINY